MTFKSFYRVVLLFLENCELHCKDALFFIIYHLLSIYLHACGQQILAKFGVIVEDNCAYAKTSINISRQL